MTREDAILCLKGIKNYGRDTFTEQSDWQESLDMAIKALEQEPILDKIRAEIKALSPEPTSYDVVDGNPIKDAVWETLADVLQIIDKYRAEGEE